MHQPFLQMSLIIILTSCSVMVQTEEKLHITLAFVAEPNTNLHGKWGLLIYTQAFSRLNIDFSYVVLPALRASNMADVGKVDGEMARTESYAKTHPSLIRIEESLFDINLSVFTANPSIKIHSWDDIKTGQYKVEYYRGITFAQQRLAQLVPPNDLTDSSYPINSLRRLLRGRIDIYVDVSLIVNELLTLPEFSDKNIYHVATLEEGKVYGYLHKRHEKIAVQLAEIFKQMKSEGLFSDYLEQARQFVEIPNEQNDQPTNLPIF